MTDVPMTAKAEAFIVANAQSPVVSGYAIGNGGKGGCYTLKDGRKFRLNTADCRAVGMPRWAFDE